jgi:hypothetical protein
VDGLSNTIFTSLLEFINEIVPIDEPALPKSTCERKKYLRHLGLDMKRFEMIV